MTVLSPTHLAEGHVLFLTTCKGRGPGVDEDRTSQAVLKSLSEQLKIMAGFVRSEPA